MVYSKSTSYDAGCSIVACSRFSSELHDVQSWTLTPYGCLAVSYLFQHLHLEGLVSEQSLAAQDKLALICFLFSSFSVLRILLLISIY